MDKERAKFILQSFRPDGADAGDPDFAEALALATKDRELGEWLAKERTRDAAFAAALGELPIPEDLREAIFGVLEGGDSELTDLDASFVGALASVRAPEGLRDKILTAMEVEQKVVRPRFGHWKWVSSAVAAVIAVSLVAVFTVGGGNAIAGTTVAEVEHSTIDLLSNPLFKLDLKDDEQAALYGWLKGKNLPAEGVSKNSIKEYTAKVLGEAVIASQIGVILDSSPSMKEYVEKLRTEISEQFRYSYFVEVEECAIDRPQGLWSRLGRNIKIHPKSSVMVRSAPWFYADPSPHLNPFLPNWHSPKDLSVLKSLDSCYVEWPALSRHSNSAFLAMIDLLDVDSIFWFSDFEDDVDEKMNNILVTLMKEKGIRLYLVSVDNKPSKMFRDYAKESGGSYRKERIRR
ncbi:DUF3379 domain-containing protein [Akkermansiaceae bacterium]|nr:DUF3379 domain-containing protein [Akkermansiaceae bacterium]